MGYALAMGSCLACRRFFSFNPVRVPSLKGEPVCESCMILANEKRVAAGVAPHPIHPQAYVACDEAEL